MKYTNVSASHRNTSGFLAPVGILLAGGILLGVDLKHPSGLLASTSVDLDPDQDGLVYRQERVLGTLFTMADSDRDGFSDSEELARGSSPTYPQFIPEVSGVHVGITAHGERDGLHAVIAVYLPDHDYSSVDLHVGVLSGSRLGMLPNDVVEARGNINFVAAAAPNAAVAIIDIRFDRKWVEATGHLTMFAAVGRRGSGRMCSAAAMDLFDIAGVIALAMPNPIGLPVMHIGGGGGSGSSAGTVYRPLTGDGEDTPDGWTMNQVCFQQSQAVAASGSIVTNEVVSASCDSGWDGSCPSSCASSVGSTYTSVDPAALIGG